MDFGIWLQVFQGSSKYLSVYLVIIYEDYMPLPGFIGNFHQFGYMSFNFCQTFPLNYLSLLFLHTWYLSHWFSDSISFNRRSCSLPTVPNISPLGWYFTDSLKSCMAFSKV